MSNKENISSLLPLRISVEASERGIQRIHLAQATKTAIEWKGPATLQPSFETWLESYLTGHPQDPTPLLDWPPLPAFTEAALKRLIALPFGSKQSYGGLAALLRLPGGARAVGQAMSRNPFPLLIPCHRVVAANGTIGGYTGELPIKKALLEFESLT